MKKYSKTDLIDSLYKFFYVLKTFDSLHNLEIAHLSNFDLTIKRDNVLITESDNLTLLDFNIIDNNSTYRYCSCVYYLEYGICKHFVALSRLTYTLLEDDVREFIGFILL
ncbi:hypothetical protein BpHYR1_026263 [Brachionus plicatilis]|uniref:SWIM-type domain-containing protein n=1 Tax=Brachionus plicatilis TaxID=10195 RepID=A0A3M7QTI8_BRAPC|nr:hypothetical protein BpHYR1_026263 [Brachionus plicatilis]